MTKETTEKKTVTAKKARQSTKQTATVKAPLNLREGPGYEWPVIRVLEAGEKLILEKKEQNGFVAAAAEDNRSGWVCAKFVEVGADD